MKASYPRTKSNGFSFKTSTSTLGKFLISVQISIVPIPQAWVSPFSVVTATLLCLQVRHNTFLTIVWEYPESRSAEQRVPSTNTCIADSVSLTWLLGKELMFMFSPQLCFLDSQMQNVQACHIWRNTWYCMISRLNLLFLTDNCANNLWQNYTGILITDHVTAMFNRLGCTGVWLLGCRGNFATCICCCRPW